MSTFFVSYSRIDREPVELIARCLEGLGHGVWLDQDIPGGQNWWDEICAHIRGSDYFVCVATPAYEKSVPCRLELTYALALNRTVLPITIDRLHKLESSLPELSSTQSLIFTLTSPEGAVRLVRAIGSLPRPASLPDPLPAQPAIPSLSRPQPSPGEVVVSALPAAIDVRTLRFYVGLSAISLPLFISFLATQPLTSLSAAYYEGGWASSMFIGFFFATGASLLMYTGLSRLENVLSKVAGLAAIAIALFPCACDGHAVALPGVHAPSMFVFFLMAGYFSCRFCARSLHAPHGEARARAAIHAVCGTVIVGSILAVFGDSLAGGALTARVPGLVFYEESIALIAWGISWLTASMVLPFITGKEERLSMLRS